MSAENVENELAEALSMVEEETNRADNAEDRVTELEREIEDLTERNGKLLEALEYIENKARDAQ